MAAPQKNIQSPKKKKNEQNKRSSKDKFSVTKCKRGDLLEYSLEDIRQLAQNMNIGLYRKSQKTGNDVFVPKKELCTEIKEKFNNYYDKDEKYNWELIKNGNIRPRRNEADSQGNLYSDVIPQNKGVNKKKKKTKKVKFETLQYNGPAPDILRNSLSVPEEIDDDSDNMTKLKAIAKKLQISHNHSNGLPRTEDELDYFIKQKYNEITKVLNKVY